MLSMLIADRHDAFLMVDEAHATGVFGPGGRGLTVAYEGRENLIAIHTCGKALGAAGALVTTTKVMRDFIVNRCRPFIFSTAPSPLMAVAVQEALVDPARGAGASAAPRGIDRVRASRDRRAMKAGGSPARRSCPLSSATTRVRWRLAAALQARGFDIRGIRPPTVPAGTARLRISLTNNVDESDVRAMLDALAEETGERR